MGGRIVRVARKQKLQLFRAGLDMVEEQQLKHHVREQGERVLVATKLSLRDVVVLWVKPQRCLC